MKTFQQKKEELAKLKDKLAKAKIVIFTSFAREGEKGLNVTEMKALKNDLRGVDSEYLVEKKTILDKALGEKKDEIGVFNYNGSLGVALGYGDEQSVSKSIYAFARKHPALKYFSAIWGPSTSSGQAGKFLDLTQFTEFAKLPSKEVMIARLLGMMRYPISALARVLDQVAKNK